MFSIPPSAIRALGISARGFSGRGKCKILLLSLLIALVLGLHYSTAHKLELRHEVFRLFFYIPLILATFWFGFWGDVLPEVPR